MNPIFSRSRRRAAGLIAAALGGALLLAAGCGGGGGTPITPITPPTPLPTGTRTQQPGWRVDNRGNGDTTVQPTKKWTILVYLNAANDLEEYGPLNLNQMEQTGSNEDINLVVQFKRIKGRFSTADGDWGGTRRYYVTRDSDTSRTSSIQLSHRDDVNMGDHETLKEFIAWGRRTYPAQRYCLVIWNHGAGWRKQPPPGAAGATRSAAATEEMTLPQASRDGRGVSYDEEYRTNGYADRIETIQLPGALDIGAGVKWDLLAWDSSLMQMTEVAHEVRDKVQYIVGSEESPPGEGFPYDLVLNKLAAANYEMDGRELGITFAREMFNANGINSDVTQSVLDASKVGAIAPAVNALGSALIAYGGSGVRAIDDARFYTEGFSYADNRDLLHLLEKLEQYKVTDDNRVRAAVDQVRAATSAAIIFNNNGRQNLNAKGLSIYFPDARSYRLTEQEQQRGFGQPYPDISFAKDAPNWQRFIAGVTP